MSKFVVGVLLGVLLVAMSATACTDDAPDTSPPATTATDPTTGSSASDAGPVTVEHRYGSTVVETRPQRIVSLDAQWTDVLLALDAPPVGYIVDPSVPDGFPWRGDGLDGSTGMTAVDTLPYEQIAALEPDLIVVAYFAQDQGDYDRLTAIAPTIATLRADQVDSWQDITTTAGRVMRDEDAAAELTADVESQVADVAAEIPDLAGHTMALVNFVPGDSFYVVSDPDDGAMALFEQLGLSISPTILDAGEGEEARVKLSLERSDLLDADLLIVFTNGGDEATIAGWDDLPAVRSGAVAVLDYAAVHGLNTPSPLSVPYSLERIRAALDATAAA